MSIYNENVVPKQHVGVYRLKCYPCGHVTSGITLPDKSPHSKFCPRCKSQLAWCGHCEEYLSAHPKSGSKDPVATAICCDVCGNEIPDRDKTINATLPDRLL